MKDTTKELLISAGKTFATAFVVTVAISFVESDTISWTLSFWGAIATAGLRAGISAVIAPYIPVKLGGKKV
jgi:hypothetical protein